MHMHMHMHVHVHVHVHAPVGCAASSCMLCPDDDTVTRAQRSTGCAPLNMRMHKIHMHACAYDTETVCRTITDLYPLFLTPLPRLPCTTSTTAAVDSSMTAEVVVVTLAIVSVTPTRQQGSQPRTVLSLDLGMHIDIQHHAGYVLVR